MERFQLKPTIFFGSDALAALEGLAGRRVMVITDSFLAQSGLLERVRARLRDCTVEVFDQVVPDPPLELVAQGARALAEFRPQAVVAFGGGSPMDCAKAMLEFGKKLGTGADIRFVAVPTTAGTGSEVTSFAVLTDTDQGVKYPLVEEDLLPEAAILDASLLEGVRQYDNSPAAIGYTVYYYAHDMEMAQGLKLLSIDGTAPSPDTIRSGEYPFLNPYYVVMDKDEAEDSPARILYDWLLGEEGQSLVAQEGYVSILEQEG